MIATTPRQLISRKTGIVQPMNEERLIRFSRKESNFGADNNCISVEQVQLAYTSAALCFEREKVGRHK